MAWASTSTPTHSACWHTVFDSHLGAVLLLHCGAQSRLPVSYIKSRCPSPSNLPMELEKLCTFPGHLHTYRFCDNVWTFILTDASFKNEETTEQVGKVKIVACDSKLLGQ
ncbi:unnamed protein product [Miscanthus lutarioriparius]|uniref:Transcription initiation factor IIA gamma subunit C-terminal domain-containing protein n=1 Tax=Miscanthus lutarioriparius TaxID=422564 RepID=A0A811NZU0_9POAL|nr:unnamed protein product [Miscanthus lutarioriparius]